MKKYKIPAVHDSDLQGVLTSAGLYSDYIKNKIKCKFCNDIITNENLCAIMPDSGSIKLICNKEECIKAMVLYTTDMEVK